ncbi:MAG: hypothetical protein WBH40_04315 [Ignavibacteriaceae bacterium]
MKSFLRKCMLIVISLVLINLTGCLSTEYKEYIFKINPDGSGEGEIIFYNLVSVEDDEKDDSFKDFGELVSDYIKGANFEDDNPNYQVTNKELFEMDSILVGRVEFAFNNFRDIGFFKSEDCDCSPLMYFMGDFGETYSESNGNYLGDEKDFPVIIWQSDTDEIYIKTVVQEDLTGTHSLLKLYTTWKDSE